jgi:predicted transglutaminase-like cysteine proteinase
MFQISPRTLRAFSFAVASIALVLPTTLVAAPAHLRAHIHVAEPSREPFADRLLLPAGGSVLGKWFDVWRQWKEEKRILLDCRTDRARCTDPAVLEFLAIVDGAKALKGRAQLGEINRAINLAIKPADDFAAHGSIDVWSSPLATLTRQAGDCEDYAILKFAALLEAGVSSEDLRIVIVRDTARSEDHGVVAVRHEGQWLVLDNRRLSMLADTELANYSPLLQLDGAGARRYSDVSPAPHEDSGASAAVEPSAIAP